jgi:ABC-2 type transport system ATP-binding protein
VIEAAQLTRRFGDRVAVEDVSFGIAAGEILALLGPNGAGKTTTLRMLAGLILPTTGAVTIDGVPVTKTSAPDLRSRIGFLTEAPGLWDRLTVRQNLLVHAALQGVRSPSEAVDRALAAFGLRDRAGDRAAELSKGLRQRAALARTLLHDPAIVLLDEPTSGVDPESARDVRRMIMRMRDDGRAVLISTHNLDEAERVADRVAVLRTRLIALDTPLALRLRLFGHRVRVVVEGPAGPYAALLRDSGALDVRADGSTLSVGAAALDTPDMVRLLVQAGARVESVAPEEVSIEDVYLRLMEPRTEVSR